MPFVAIDLQAWLGALTIDPPPPLTLASGDLLVVSTAHAPAAHALMRRLVGLEPDAPLCLSLEGRAITPRRPAHPRLACVPADLGLWPELDVRSHLRIGLQRLALPRRALAGRLRLLADQWGLLPWLEALPGELTPAIARDLAWARAVATAPALIVSGDAWPLRDESALAALRQRLPEETALAFIAPGWSPAAALANQALLLDESGAWQLDTPPALARRPLSVPLALRLGTANLLPATWVRAEGSVGLAQTVLGPFSGVSHEHTEPPAEGAPAAVVFRPEAVHLDRYPAEDNAFAVTLRGGRPTTWGALLELHTDAGLTVAAHHPDRRLLDAQGQNWHAWVDPEDVTLLDGTGENAPPVPAAPTAADPTAT